MFKEVLYVFNHVDLQHTSNCNYLIIFELLRKNEKKIGWGSLSLLLTLLGMAVSFEFGNYILGDQLLSFLGLPAWSSSVDNTRFHYTIYLSSIFLFPV